MKAINEYIHSQVLDSFIKLQDYCEQEEFKGWDPYDGLNSNLFKSIPFISKNHFVKLIWIQLFKRSPVNFRNISGVKKEYNPKGLGLFLSGYCNLYKIEPKTIYLERITFLSKKLLELQNTKFHGSCWGYNFDWQARAFFQPKNTPTVVASVFIASALIDAYEITGDKKLLNTAISTCDFILKDLNRTYDKNKNFCFSYSPLDKSVVFNASFLGSRLLARVFSYKNDSIYLTEAKKSVGFCCSQQQRNGSWSYGSLPYHQWIDNFHTGYNLECIADYMKYSEDNSYKEHLNKGFDYYIQTFFTEKGIPKYYNNSVYPIDIHASAQLVITLAKLKKFHEQKKIMDKVLDWTIKKMQSDKGYFYYQVNKYFSTKISYMRWAQSWMFYALTTYIKVNRNREN